MQISMEELLESVTTALLKVYDRKGGRIAVPNVKRYVGWIAEDLALELHIREVGKGGMPMARPTPSPRIRWRPQSLA